MEVVEGIETDFSLIELCVKVAKYIAEAKGATKDRTILKAEILACQSLLQGLEDEYNGANGKEWANTMETLKGAGAPLTILGETLGLLAKKLTKTTILTSLNWPFQESESRKDAECH